MHSYVQKWGVPQNLELSNTPVPATAPPRKYTSLTFRKQTIKPKDRSDKYVINSKKTAVKT